MEREKIALGTLVVIIVAVLGLYLLSNYGALENLFQGEKKIEMGDCVDFHFVGRYSNGEIFGYSYDDLINKTGDSYQNVFLSYDESSSPPDGYGNYSNKLLMPYGEYYNKDLIDGLVGLKEGDTATIGPIQPDGTHGELLEVGDEINLTEYVGASYILSIYDVEEYVDMPSDYQQEYGEVTTYMYKLKDESHYIGEIIESEYTFWTNSTEITKINDTLIWKYTTPQTAILENFTYTWAGIDTELENQVKIDYPINSSYVSSFNDSTIVITHNPAIDSNITLSTFSLWGYQPYISYTVQNISGDKINTTYTDSITGNTSYREFNRTVEITRNQTQSIVQEAMPGELLEYALLSYIRSIDSDFKYGYNPFTWPSSFEVEVVNIYKTSDES